ncbi:NFX1-type zinc finger-containing protein 1-like [Mya arenaria]|uniref:NFX1-type zinc finger-containing protein 1-like n=1 Tax=Mya arenaria TaxID=6604 RepID=UPI0022E600AA|nr:NFX1-type zinc finger-containing protein 1-like [Mya arenaria]
MADGFGRDENYRPRRPIRAGLPLRRNDDGGDAWDDEADLERRVGGGRGGGGRGGGRGQGRGRGRGGGAPRRQQLDKRFLDRLAGREPADILQTISNPQTELRDTLARSATDDTLIPLLLRVLAKAFTCNSQPECLNRVLIIIKEAKFFDTVVSYFMDMQGEERPHKQQEFRRPLRDMVTVMSEFAEKNPSSITEIVGLHTVLQMVIDGLRATTGVIDDDILENFRLLTETKEKILRKRTAKKRTVTEERQRQIEDTGEEPPNDFREIEIFPQTADMQDDDDRYLRANKVRGRYRDVDHYLDVQFRLLREDFIAPLREGVSEYIQAMNERGRQRKGKRNVTIYHNVSIISPECGDNGLCHVIRFDVSRMGHVRWQSSKRLIFGSLLSLSSDNFRTFVFATVMNRDPKSLVKGIVTVRFECKQAETRALFGQLFTMAETTAYFESYKHVLKGLQNMRETELPFQRYIVECERHVQPPAYLRRRENTCFDLRPLVDEGIILKDNSQLENILADGDEDEEPITYTFSEHSQEAEDVKVLDRNSWPPADLLHLDESQFKAIHTALTQEFVITQGPPGTGKTYIGLKIVKALLHNKDAWTRNPDTGLKDNRPMLIVCYTNHALDQFLEGIISFYKGDVVRVGSRSNSEVLKPYNLHNFRQRFRHEKKIPVQIFKGRREAKYEMDSVTTQIRQVSAQLQISTTNIMNEDFLRPYMGEDHYHLLTIGFEMILQVYPEARQVFRQGHSIIVEWLGIGNLAPIVEMEANVAAGDMVFDNNFEDGNDLIEAEDELDAIQAQRQLDDRDEDDEGEDGDDEIDRMINEFRDSALTGKNLVELKVKVAATAHQKSVALDVNALDEKPQNTQEGEWKTQKKERKKQKRKLQMNLSKNEVMSEEDLAAVTDIWHISTEDKWKLYRLWIKKYQDHQLEKIKEKEEEFDAAAARYKEALMQEDKEIMRHSTIIGMTTTGAARYQLVLQEIRSRIVVVEEAAEVLEAHIITTLSRGCEHLILIGDHKQLKPNPTVYKLATEYKLDVSLFERMINNGIQCDCLELQHRMRPEIAELIKPIYKNLRNHSDVQNYEPIRGVASNMFFITHSEHEANDEDLRSHSNVHEAEYIVELCRYLIKQGYEAQQITVLTLYSGQLFCLKGLMPKSEFEGVKLTVVDNYQGEENDIVLLSLVRSNNDDSIGFLKTDNRVCVALSRAKKGFYVIGNFELLQRRSKLWSEIVIDMKQKKRFGEGLLLQCQNHPDEKPLEAKIARDFAKAPEGGCNKRCGQRLDCGHLCERFCHPLDQDHKGETSRCRKRCNKIICGNKHKCPLRCGQKCESCKEEVEKIIPRCGHVQKVQCSIPPADFTCLKACQSILPCGHKCQSKCGMAHTQDCGIKVEKTWPCGHKAQIKCHQEDTAICPAACDGALSCDHRCRGTCGQCFQGRLHVPCQNECMRILVCGHECQDRCSQCPPCKRPCENQCQHSKCPRRCGELCAPCREPCTWRCEHYKCTNICSEPCDRPPCDKACRKRLACGHPCIGLCGEPCPTDCRVCDKQKVTEIFFGDEDEEDARFVLLQDCRMRCIFEVNGMDTYMETKVDEKGEIKLKDCPKCRTPIRRTVRYRSTINQTLTDIEQVKSRVLVNKTRLRKLREDIRQTLEEIEDERNKLILRRRMEKAYDEQAENALAALLNQSRFLSQIGKQKSNWAKLKGLAYKGEREKAFLHIGRVVDWIMSERSLMTAQETEDAELEFDRLRAQLKLLMFQMRANEKRIQLDNTLKAKIRDAEKTLNGTDKFKGDVKAKVEDCLRALQNIIPTTELGISEEERIMIVKAMELQKGHWFKCRKGHVYAIGDCGGATMESRCPECNSRIGGADHRLRADNVLATEMDGADHAAWSEQANMVNYGFDARF